VIFLSNTTTVRVLRKHYNQISKIQQELGQRSTIQDEINYALEFYITHRNQAQLLADSKLEEIVLNRLRKFEDRIAGLLGKTGMDVSIVLIGFLKFLSDELNMKETDLYDMLRPLAAKYYTKQRKHKDEDE